MFEYVSLFGIILGFFLFVFFSSWWLQRKNDKAKEEAKKMIPVLKEVAKLQSDNYRKLDGTPLPNPSDFWLVCSLVELHNKLQTWVGEEKEENTG